MDVAGADLMEGSPRGAPGGASGPPSVRRRWGLTLVTLALAAAFLVLVHRRTLTYVCGNDPMLYIRAARTLLAPGLYGAEAVRHALTFVAPGYPLILAAAIKLFGPLAPYWVNLAFLLAALPLMWLVFRRLMGSDRAAAFSLAGLLLIVVRSHELNAPYLLYPFREAARLFFVYAAYACVLLGLRPEGLRRGWVLGGSLALLAACAIREPTALVLPGLLLGMALLPPGGSSKRGVWLWFGLPWAAVAAVAALALSRWSLAGISQFEVLRFLGEHRTAWARGAEMLGWFPARSGWLATGLMLLGVARALLRARVLCAWFLLPGLLLFAFCAYMQMHARYFLSALLFLAVFAGYGLDGACSALERIAGGGRGRPRLATALAWGGLALLAQGLWHTAGQARVWGPAIGAGEVRAWQSLVAGLQPSADGRVRIAVEQRSRYLEDLLLAYTDADLLDPKQMDGWPARWAPAHFFQPLNRKARYQVLQWLPSLKINARRILADSLDLLPAGAGEPLVRTLGEGRFEQFGLRPWAPGRHRQEFPVEPRRDQVVWLDWGALPPGSSRRVTVTNASSGASWFSGTMAGGGLQALALGADRVDGGLAALTIDAADPAPSRPLAGVVEAARPLVFAHDDDRLVSLNRLFPGRESDALDTETLSWPAGRRLSFRAPVLHSAWGGGWVVCFRGKINFDRAMKVRVRGQGGGETVHEATDDDGVCLGVGGGEALQLELERPGGPPSGRWQVDRVSFEYRPAGRAGG